MMGEIINTRLRFISSKEIAKIILYSNSLAYKIEIKGGPAFNPKDKRWYLFFVIPDSIDSKLESISGELD